MKKLFISYSHEDVVFVKKFTLLLSLYGFDVWMDRRASQMENIIPPRF